MLVQVVVHVLHHQGLLVTVIQVRQDLRVLQDLYHAKPQQDLDPWAHLAHLEGTEIPADLVMMATLVLALAVMVNQEIRADQADLAMTAHVVLEANQEIRAFLVFQVLLQALANTQFKLHASHRHHKFHHQ